MAENKKYYWLKLKEDFFRDKRIKKLRRIAGGDTYTVIYLKMQLLSIKNNGVLVYEGIEDNFAEELALELDEDIENVKVTLAFLQGNGMIEETEQDKFLMTETIKCIGSESSSAERVRKYRAKKQAALQCNTQVTIGNTEIEKEKEKEIGSALCRERAPSPV
jgi:predicted phage replisome organizer